MNRAIYTFLFYLLSPVIWAYLLFRAIKAPEYRDGFRQRLGILSQSIKGKGILVHCASVGETRAAAPLIKRLVQEFPDLSVTVSTTTPTGKKAVAELFGGKVQHVYLPIDWPGSVRRFLTALEPQLVILMETELWLNLISECGRRAIPVLLANARLSDKSLNKYLKHQKLARQLFSGVSYVAAQYQSDKDNFCRLGVNDSKVGCVGSIKFDIEITPQLLDAHRLLKQQWAENRPVWIAASIHPAEFDWVLKAHRQLLESFPDLLLIGVPRHPEKFVDFKSACDKHNLPYISRSNKEPTHLKTRVIVGDTMGEMMLFCGVANIAYVGGSLIERGGHNPLEPLACGVPVVMGPHFYNFSDICQLLIQQDLLAVVENEQQLAIVIEGALADQSTARIKAEKSESFMQQNRGCVDRLVTLSHQLITR